MDGQRLAVALTTLDFEPIGNGTNLTVTVQIVSFVGPEMIHGYESGYKGDLNPFLLCTNCAPRQTVQLDTLLVF